MGIISVCEGSFLDPPTCIAGRGLTNEATFQASEVITPLTYCVYIMAYRVYIYSMSHYVVALQTSMALLQHLVEQSGDSPPECMQQDAPGLQVFQR